MRLRKMIPMQLLLAGLASTFLLGSAARAQQDTDPTNFEATSMVPQSNASSTTQNAHNSSVGWKSEKPVVASLANQAGKDTTLEASVARMMAAEVAIFATLLIGIASIVLYAMAATRRENQLQVSPDRAQYTTTTSA